MGFHLIGLAGPAQSGKDTIAIILKEKGYRRLAFADGVRDAVYKLNPHIGYDGLRVQDLVKREGWDKAKQRKEIRRLLQVMGTEVGRELFGKYVWVDKVMRQVKDDKFVITDVRFPNEADTIREYGGFVFKVERPGVNPLNEHASENAMAKYEYDGVILNNGTIDDLRESVRIFGV